MDQEVLAALAKSRRDRLLSLPVEAYPAGSVTYAHEHPVDTSLLVAREPDKMAIRRVERILENLR